MRHVDERGTTQSGVQANSLGANEQRGGKARSPLRRPRSRQAGMEVPATEPQGIDEVVILETEKMPPREVFERTPKLGTEEDAAWDSDIVEMVSNGYARPNCRQDDADAAGRSSRAPKVPPISVPVNLDPVVVDLDLGDEPAPASPEWPKQIWLSAVKGRITENVTNGRYPRLCTGTVVELAAAEGVVRFSVGGHEFGQLPANFATALAPALKTRYVEASGSVARRPIELCVFATVDLEIKIYLCKAAFESAKERVALSTEPSSSLRKTKRKRRRKGVAKRSRGKHVSGSSEVHAGMDAGRLAVMNLVSMLDLWGRAARGSEVEDVEDTCDPGQRHLSGGVEVYYQTVRQIDATLPEYEHPSELLCELHEYQKHGVAWMQAREVYGSSREGATGALLDPLWKRKEFIGGCTFFMNDATGSLSLDPPLIASEGPFGGILADERGLGKTVECIAVMVLDRVELDSRLGSGWEDEGGGYAGDDCHAAAGVRSKVESPRICSADRCTVINLCDEVDADSHKPDATMLGIVSAGPEVASGVFGNQEGLHSIGPERRMDGPSSRMSPGVVPTPSADPSEGLDIDCESSESGNSSDQEHDEWEPGEHGYSADDDSDVEPPKRRRLFRRRSRRKRDGESLDAVRANLEDSESPARRRVSSKFQHLHALRRKEPVEASKLIGGTLLVVPKPMMSQWVGELQKHVEHGFFRIVSYRECPCMPRKLSVQEVDVVVTTYEVVASETSEDVDEHGGLRGDGALFSIAWRRIILDEAHSIKGRVTKIAKACFLLTAKLRWCVTGSPIQNHVSDVQPLLRFIGVQPWSSWELWQRDIVVKLEASDANMKAEALSTIRRVLSPLMLRRLKSTLGSDGKPLVNLLPRPEEVKLTSGRAHRRCRDGIVGSHSRRSNVGGVERQCPLDQSTCPADLARSSGLLLGKGVPLSPWSRRCAGGRSCNRFRANSKARSKVGDDVNEVNDELSAALQNGLLFHSIVQTGGTSDNYHAEEDSDEDDIVDEDWRLALCDRLITDYADTSVLEMLYMNLWNQYVMREAYVDSDRRQQLAVVEFARRYGCVLTRLNLEVIFVRHLTELASCGLIDASGMHMAVVALGEAKATAENGIDKVEERLAEFEFLNRLKRRFKRYGTHWNVLIGFEMPNQVDYGTSSDREVPAEDGSTSTP